MPRLFQRLLTAVVTLTLVFPSPAALAHETSAFSAPAASNGEIAVLFHEELTALDLAALERTYGLVAERPLIDPQLITFATADVNGSLAAVRQDPQVEVASEVTLSRRQTADPLFINQWWLQNVGQDLFIGTAYDLSTGASTNTFPTMTGNDIRWEQAMALPACGSAPCTGRGVTVAIVDSGVDASHPDLAGQISGDSTSKDPADPSIVDREGHGTFLAGLIGARKDDGVGISGAAPDAKLLVVKDDLSSDSTSSAIRYAAEHGAAVINISEGSRVPNDMERAAINYATQPPFNAIVVASAGNSAVDDCSDPTNRKRCPYGVQNPVLYPASFDHVISVGSVNPDGIHTDFSEYNDKIDVSAPGTSITSLLSADAQHEDCSQNWTPAPWHYAGPTDCMFTVSTSSPGWYMINNGTSFSAPLVSAAAALAKQKWPAITSDQFKQLLHIRSDSHSGGVRDDYYGYGTLNLARLLSYNFPPQIAPGQVSFTAPAVTNDGSGTTTIVAKVDDLDGPSDISDVTADLSAVGLPASVTMNADGATFASSPQIIPTSVTPGQYAVNVTAHDKAGQTATASATLTVVAAGTPISTPPPVVGIGTPSTDVALSITRPSKRKEMTTRKKTITVSGTAGAGAAFVEVNGESASLDSTHGTWSARVQLAKGENTIDIKSYDVTRTKSDAASVTVTYDITPPGNVSGLTATTEGSSTHLSWRAPRDRDVAGFHIYDVNGSAPREVTTSTTTSATVSSAGSFAVTAEDTAGNESNLDNAPRTSTVVFTDVPKDHFAAAAIADLAGRGIVQGSGGLFRPNDPVTRAEFAKMLVGVRKENASTAPSKFADVPTGDSFTGFVSTIARLGWANGQGDHFYPSRSVTRFEAAAMIVRAASLGLANSAPFSDVTDPSEQAVIGTLVTQGIASGQNGSFFPHRPLTRGEAAKMLEKVAL